MTYCTCRKSPGYVSLRDEHNTFVCGACLLPSWLVYLASERYCEECGCSIFTRWELICSPCQTALLDLATDLRREGVSPDDMPPNLTELKPGRVWVGWERARERAQDTWPYRWESAA